MNRVFDSLKGLITKASGSEPAEPAAPPPKPSGPHILNIRQQGSNDPFSVYSPTRDLANVGGELLHRAYVCCTDAGIPDCVKASLVASNSNAEGAQVALACLAEAAVNAVRPDNEQLPIGEALERSGFNSLSIPTRVAALAHFGASCLAAIVHCTKDVTYEVGPNPHLDQIRKVVENSRIVAREAFNRSQTVIEPASTHCCSAGADCAPRRERSDDAESVGPPT